jgi:small subunit ribosomal protein S19e
MGNVKSIEAGNYNKMLAEALKNEKWFIRPDWVNFVKSSANRSRPIDDDNFWQKRAASILRQVYINKIVGVQRLRTRYGGIKDRGQKPKRFMRGGDKIIRTILKQGEDAGLLEKGAGTKKGRHLTKKGRDYLEKVADGNGDKNG